MDVTTILPGFKFFASAGIVCALLFLFVVAAKGKTSTEASIIGLVAVIFSLIAVMMT